MTAPKAHCLRCGALSSPQKGGQLVPVKGLTHKIIGPSRRPHKQQEWQHADSQFCDLRIPHSKRTPTANVMNPVTPFGVRR